MNKMVALIMLSLFLVSCTFEKECTFDSDCVPASCCHPDSCTVKSGAPDCRGVFCTMNCEPGTLDCGRGECACVKGKCSVRALV